ncbi:carbohydrate ABC transporter permease, partial [Eubacteriales bacterium OttesenSCG-928-A19]|nr:carbohydrate ABC transporter permease [Eubacteriales bacterium OttesenSCG-928-A19]
MSTSAVPRPRANKIKRSRVFTVINSLIMLFLVIITLYPFYYVIIGSISGDNLGAQEVFYLYPKGLDFGSYKMVFSTASILRAYGNTLFVTTVGTVLSLILTTLTGYPLSKNRLKGRRLITTLMYFTMLFNGGLVPTYLVIRDLGMIDSLWALIWPKVISVYNMLLLINFFKSIPEGMEESAYIDGANDFTILMRVILPLSLPIFATLTLFYAVTYWNSWFDAVMYLNRNRNFPLQLVLREIVQSVDLSYVAGGGADFSMSDMTIQSVRLATIVVSILPIMC